MPSHDRSLITKLARASRGGLITVSNASDVLELSRRAAALKLGGLARRGWLQRAKRGLYLVVPLEADPGSASVAEDPWVLAREAFAPCYIGGWSAAEHWGLTEQIFKSTLVVTSIHARASSTSLLGHEFRLFRVSPARLRAPTAIWRGAERVQASDRERTIVDCLRNPELCGGIRHLREIMRTYGESAERDIPKLIKTARQFASGAAWKRLGYLSTLLWPEEIAVPREARRHVTTGNVRLDPAIESRGKLVRRWGLWVNTSEKYRS